MSTNFYVYDGENLKYIRDTYREDVSTRSKTNRFLPSSLTEAKINGFIKTDVLIETLSGARTTFHVDKNCTLQDVTRHETAIRPHEVYPAFRSKSISPIRVVQPWGLIENVNPVSPWVAPDSMMRNILNETSKMKENFEGNSFHNYKKLSSNSLRLTLSVTEVKNFKDLLNPVKLSFCECSLSGPDFTVLNTTFEGVFETETSLLSYIDMVKIFLVWVKFLKENENVKSFKKMLSNEKEIERVALDYATYERKLSSKSNPLIIQETYEKISLFLNSYLVRDEKIIQEANEMIKNYLIKNDLFEPFKNNFSLKLCTFKPFTVYEKSGSEGNILYKTNNFMKENASNKYIFTLLCNVYCIKEEAQVKLVLMPEYVKFFITRILSSSFDSEREFQELILSEVEVANVSKEVLDTLYSLWTVNNKTFTDVEDVLNIASTL